MQNVPQEEVVKMRMLGVLYRQLPGAYVRSTVDSWTEWSTSVALVWHAVHIPVAAGL
jgi:hypothetical protein